MRLRRVLGVAFGIAVTLGGTLGIGILRTPGMVAQAAGTSWGVPLIWAAGGVFALFATAAIAEVAVSIPRTGGFQVYAREAFGPTIGFAVGWSDFLAQTAAIAYAAVTASDLLARLGWSAPYAGPALILIVGGLHWLGTRFAGLLQSVVSFGLAACYIALVFVSFVYGSSAPHSSPGAATELSLGAAILAFRAVIVTYDGWYSSIYFPEEVADAQRNLPRAMLRGVLLVIAVYLGINAALVATLDVESLAASSFPAVDAAQKLFGPAGERVVIAVALLSIPSLLSALILMGSRIVYGLGARRVGSRGTPESALAVTTVASLLLTLSGTFPWLLAAAAFFYATTYMGGFAVLFVLRRRATQSAPFRAWLHPWSTVVLLALCATFLIGDLIANPWDALRAALLLAAGYPVYRLLKARRILDESA